MSSQEQGGKSVLTADQRIRITRLRDRRPECRFWVDWDRSVNGWRAFVEVPFLDGHATDNDCFETAEDAVQWLEAEIRSEP